MDRLDLLQVTAIYNQFLTLVLTNVVNDQCFNTEMLLARSFQKVLTDESTEETKL
jgi:hypothetical protein